MDGGDVKPCRQVGEVTPTAGWSKLRVGVGGP